MQVNSTIDPNSEAGDRFLNVIRRMLKGFIIFGLICLAVALVFLGKTLVTRGDFAEYILPIVFGALGVGFTVVPWVVKKYTVDLFE